MGAPRYTNRKPGCNPRTGAPLPKWQDVQVMDPTTPSYTRVQVKFEVEVERGSRLLVLNVPYTGTDLHDVAIAHARALGFQVKRVVEGA